MFETNKLTVLYIESDPELRENISLFMNNLGLNVLKTDHSATGLDLLRTNKIDIILIDLDQTENDRLEFIHLLRQKDIESPAIIVTSKSDSSILMKAINLEITRYLLKPFKNSELLEALHVASKKVIKGHFTTFTQLQVGYSYDPINKSIHTSDNEAIQLSNQEYLLVELLLKNKRQITSYEEIETAVWGENPMSMDTLRTLIRGIRKKTYTGIITNCNGIGYKIDY
jgi:DNA-binding response OmpR family regulator